MRSGAVERHLESLGISTDALRAVSEARAADDWVTATEEFRNRHPEWPGGPNREVLGQILVENGWVNSNDKLSALEKAYKFATQQNMLVANPDVEYQREVAAARSTSEIADLNAKYYGSGLFNR